MKKAEQDPLKFTSDQFPDVGGEHEVFSWSNHFDWPNVDIPIEPGKGEGTHEATEAFFSQPRRRG